MTKNTSSSLAVISTAGRDLLLDLIQKQDPSPCGIRDDKETGFEMTRRTVISTAGRDLGFLLLNKDRVEDPSLRFGMTRRVRDDKETRFGMTRKRGSG